MRILAAALLASLSAPALARPADDARATYLRFAAAQNARDLQAVASVLLDSDRFLWVSDGQSIWGRAATIERMSLFQQAPVWRVVPQMDKAVPVELSEEAAYLHLPLELVIGSEAAPDHLRFLVSVLCVKTGSEWKIAALFTTGEKTP